METRYILNENASPICKIIHVFLLDPNSHFWRKSSPIPHIEWSFKAWNEILNEIQFIFASNVEKDEKKQDNGFKTIRLNRELNMTSHPTFFYLPSCKIKDISNPSGAFHLENFKIQQWIYSYDVSTDISLKGFGFKNSGETGSIFGISEPRREIGSIFQLSDNRWMSIQSDLLFETHSIVLSDSLHDLIHFGLTENERKKFRIKLFPSNRIKTFLQNFFVNELCQIIIEYAKDYIPSEKVILHLLFQSPSLDRYFPDYAETRHYYEKSDYEDDEVDGDRRNEVQFDRQFLFSSSKLDKQKYQMSKHHILQKINQKRKLRKKKKITKYKQNFIFKKKKMTVQFNARKFKHKQYFSNKNTLWFE